MTKKHKRKASLSAAQSSPAKLLRRESGSTGKSVVHFNLQRNVVLATYNNSEYDRSIPMTEWWRKFEGNQMTHAEVVAVYWSLDVYKLREMLPALRNRQSISNNDCHPSLESAHSVLSALRLDIINTPYRLDLIANLSDQELYTMSLLDIQTLLADHLVQYNQEVAKVMPTLAALTSHLTRYIESMESDLKIHPILDVYLGAKCISANIDGHSSQDQAGNCPANQQEYNTIENVNTCDVSSLASNGVYFDVLRVHEMIAQVDHQCNIPLEKIAAIYKMSDKYLTRIQTNVELLTRYYFTKFGQPIDTQLRDKLTALVLIAVGHFDIGLRARKQKKRRQRHMNTVNDLRKVQSKIQSTPLLS